MKLSLKGYYRTYRGIISEAENTLNEHSNVINHDDFQTLEAALEHAKDTANVLFDTIMALLTGEIGKGTAIEFFALSPDDLKNHKHTNDLVTFTPNTEEEHAHDQ